MSHTSHNEDPHHDEEPADSSAGNHPSGNAERYEIEDLFRGEAPENQHFIKVAGIVILVVFLFLSLAYPFTFLLP